MLRENLASNRSSICKQINLELLLWKWDWALELCLSPYTSNDWRTLQLLFSYWRQNLKSINLWGNALQNPVPNFLFSFVTLLHPSNHLPSSPVSTPPSLLLFTGNGFFSSTSAFPSPSCLHPSITFHVAKYS